MKFEVLLSGPAGSLATIIGYREIQEGAVQMPTLRMVLRDREKQFIWLVLRECKWDKVKTAKQLGIGLSTLYRKIAEHKIKHN